MPALLGMVAALLAIASTRASTRPGESNLPPGESFPARLLFTFVPNYKDR